MTLNWDAIEKEAQENSFKDYAPNGVHEVTVESAKINENGNGWFDFQFKETEVKYPKLSFAFFGDDKQNFRAHYYKEVMKALGATEENARKAVDVCESKENRPAVHKAYADAFSRLAKRHPKIQIEVRDQYDRNGSPVVSENGNVYGESTFTKESGLQFAQKKKAQTQGGDLEIDLGLAEDLGITEADIPF